MAATTVTYEKGKPLQLDLTQLQTDPCQPRKYPRGMITACGNYREKLLKQAMGGRCR
jgi:hypothetical protein